MAAARNGFSLDTRREEASVDRMRDATRWMPAHMAVAGERLRTGVAYKRNGSASPLRN